MNDSRDSSTLLTILLETSFKSDEGGNFRLSSGKSSKYYVDCKMALSRPDARKLMGRLIAHRLGGSDIDAVGGLELGAYPLAAAVSDAIFDETGRLVRAFAVRKEPKKHGLKKWIEGDIREGDRALIVDDVTTSGGSVIKAIDCARNAGLIVARVILLIDREEGGRENVEAKQVRFEALFKLSDLLKSAESGAERSDAGARSPGTIDG